MKIAMIAVLAGTAMTTVAMAQTITPPGTPVTPGAGVTTVTGALTASTNPVLGTESLFATYSGSYTNVTGPVFTGVVSGLNVGASFRVRTGPTPPATASFDTYLRIRSGTGATILGGNDDGPSGVTPWSQVTGTVPAGGTISFDASWWQNSAMSPTYTTASVTGTRLYDVQVFSQPILTPSILGNRVQMWDVSLTPGAVFTAWTNAVAGSGVTDTMLAFFDSSGNLIGSNDDRSANLAGLTGGSFYSGLQDFTAPGDGFVRMVVSNYNGFGSDSNPASYVNGTANNVFTGATAGVGGISLNIMVPTPGAAGVMGLGLLAAARRRRA